LPPSLFQNPQATKRLYKERAMHPLLLIAIPLVLVIVGGNQLSLGIALKIAYQIKSKS
jgi:hypothetical protein